MRKFTPDDLDKIIELRSDDKVAWGLGGARTQTREFNETRLRFYLDCYEKLGYGACAIVWKETNELIGWAGLQPLEDTGETEVGYGMAKAFWRRGIGFEAAQAWLDYGFKTIGLERIVAVALPENAGSRRIMEKLGMTHEKNEVHYGSELVFYAVSRDRFLSQPR